MSLGNNLYKARRKKGLSQETVANALGISRQTVSKWETDETLPNVFQAKEMARLYELSLDDLMEYDADVQEIEKVIQNTSAETQKKIDWTKMWSKQYPVLGTYTDVVDVPCLDAHVDDVRHDQRYGQLKACLSDDEQDAEDKFLLKWSKVCENAFQVLQDNPPFRVKFLFL